MINNNIASTTLRNVVGRSFILAYKENPNQLKGALEEEGLRPEIMRASYSPEQMRYSRATRTFMNHLEAWKRAVASSDYTLICESDFVPCIGLGNLPTFWPLQNPMAWGYLYQGSPRLLALIGDKPFLRAHTAPLVSYVLNAAVAEILIRFYHRELEVHRPEDYFTFDSHLQWFAMGQGAEAYMPLYHYGEHGGLPNPEHARHGLRRAGVHRADNLARALHFMPIYAEGSLTKLTIERSKGRLFGWARLFSGRWISRTNVYKLPLATLIKMHIVGIKRLAGPLR
jgi:hypothetical protein